MLTWPGAFRRESEIDDYGYDEIHVPVVPEKPTAEQSAALDAVRVEIDRLCLPASQGELVQELAKLRISTAHRDATPTDEKAALLVFMEDIGEFPGDIVRDACRAWRRREKWFPTPAELRNECQKRAHARFKWRDALRAKL